MNEIVKRDCTFFKGDTPCNPHKKYGVHCGDCNYYEPKSGRILIIKLGAIGDVIRTTPLLHRLKKEFPSAEIWWLTRSLEILPEVVDRKLDLTLENILVIQATDFISVYNLDKDPEACALAGTLNAGSKKGFMLDGGKCKPVDAEAEHKFLTGLFDDYSRQNTKSYQQEIFEICGFEFQGEKYILKPPPADVAPAFDSQEKKVIGLNTGCGARWPSRQWPDDHWIDLAKRLQKDRIQVLLLGGHQEHEKNLKIAKLSGAAYIGYFNLEQFTALMDRCDLVVTSVTMAMHLAIGLDKKIILFNNIFNKNEFELYGQGEILEPEFDCDCYYTPVCENNCMQYISVETTYDSCLRLLMQKKSEKQGK